MFLLVHFVWIQQNNDIDHCCFQSLFLQNFKNKIVNRVKKAWF